MKEYMIQTTDFRFTIKAHKLEVYTRGESNNTDPFTYLLAYDEDGKVIGYFENVIWYMEKSAYIEIEEVDNETKKCEHCGTQYEWR